MRKLAVAAAVLVVASSPTFAGDAVEDFRRASSDYSVLQTDMKVLNIQRDSDGSLAAKYGVAARPNEREVGRQWCHIAKSYDRYVAALERVIKDKEYLDMSHSGAGFVEVADRDLPAFRTELEGRRIDLRDAERRCKP